MLSGHDGVQGCRACVVCRRSVSAKPSPKEQSQTRAPAALAGGFVCPLWHRGIALAGVALSMHLRWKPSPTASRRTKFHSAWLAAMVEASTAMRISPVDQPPSRGSAARTQAKTVKRGLHGAGAGGSVTARDGRYPITARWRTPIRRVRSAGARGSRSCQMASGQPRRADWQRRRRRSASPRGARRSPRSSRSPGLPQAGNSAGGTGAPIRAA